MEEYKIQDEQTFKKSLRDLGFPEPLINDAYEHHKKGLDRFEPSPDLVERTLKEIKEKHPELFRKQTLYERIKNYFS